MNLAVILLAAAAPTVSVNSFDCSDAGIVTIGYTLANGPAVVTMDIETNGPSGWASIGAANIYPAAAKFRPTGDVNRLVSGSSGSIRWRANRTWPNQSAEIRAVLTAWAADDTPDYMVVDMNPGVAAADRVKYYASSNALPGGGLFALDDYRTTHLVMKKVVAKDITWTMGSFAEYGRTAASEVAHEVTLSNNYYLGVFPVTQKQCSMMYGSNWTGPFPVDGAMRIRDRLYWYLYQPFVRGDTLYPEAPTTDSLLGKLRIMTAGVIDDWDLPSEAQWEYAAKAGDVDCTWGDGTLTYLSPTNYSYDANLPGRYKLNQTDPNWCTSVSEWSANNSVQPISNGPPIAGSYRPNAWGFYDMFGGVREWCLDWHQNDISAYGGALNANGEYTLDGNPSGGRRVQRGGSWRANANGCRATTRDSGSPTYPADYQDVGFRVWCRAGLK